MIRIFTALAVAASVATAPAFAASDEFKMEIDVNRTQLETVVGAQEEYDRIRDEVNARCTSEHVAYNFGKALAVRQCLHRQGFFRQSGASASRRSFARRI